MKKLLILIFVFCMLFGSCDAEEPEISKSSEADITFAARPAVKKEILKLGHSLGDFDSAEGSVMKMQPANIPFDIPEDLENGKGLDVEIPEETVNAIRELCSDFVPDENWHNMVNYYTQDFAYGMLEFTYYIDNISTDKVVFCNIENGTVTEVGFRNITAEVDENALLARVNAFEENHEQEKYEFKDGEEFLSEDISYVYYYTQEKLVYCYQLFFYMDTPVGKVVNNDYGSEYFVE